MEATMVVQLLNTGIGGVSLFLLYNLWLEFKAQNAFIRDLLKAQIDADLDRAAIKRELRQITGSHKIQP